MLSNTVAQIRLAPEGSVSCDIEEVVPMLFVPELFENYPLDSFRKPLLTSYLARYTALHQGQKSRVVLYNT